MKSITRQLGLRLERNPIIWEKSTLSDVSWYQKIFSDIHRRNQLLIHERKLTEHSISYKELSSPISDVLREGESTKTFSNINFLVVEISRDVRNLIRSDVVGTIATLVHLHDLPLETKEAQKVFREYDGYDVIINLLEVNDPRCHIGALQIIYKLTTTRISIDLLVEKGIIPPLINLLSISEIDVVLEVTRVLVEMSQIYKPTRYIRKEQGYGVIMDNMVLCEEILYTPKEQLAKEQVLRLDLAILSAQTLKNASAFPPNVKHIYGLGLSKVMRALGKSRHHQLLVQTFGILENCAKEESIQIFLEVDGIIVQLINGLKTSDVELRSSCLSTVAMCAAGNEATRHVVRLLGGLRYVVRHTADRRQSRHGLRAAVAAASKLSQEMRNVRLMSRLGLVDNLIAILKTQFTSDAVDTDIMAFALEGLAECARVDENVSHILQSGIVQRMASMLFTSEGQLLVASAQCVGSCARSPPLRNEIMRMDGIRLLLNAVNVGLTKNMPAVTATALWALQPMVRNCGGEAAAEELRSLMCGPFMFIEALHSADPSVQMQACAVVALVAENRMNRHILTEWGIVGAVAACAQRSGPLELLQHACDAVGALCGLPWNAHEFGLLGVVTAVANLLYSKCYQTHLSAVRALGQLTLHSSFNCVLLHQSGTVRRVLLDCSSTREELQSAATVVLRNMRRVAREVEEAQIRKGCWPDSLKSPGSHDHPVMHDSHKLAKLVKRFLSSMKSPFSYTGDKISR